MKKFGMIALALVTVMGVYAQKGVEDGSRYGHGEDSINTWRNISMYQEYYKTNDFKEAYEQGWKEVFRDAPLASVNTYNYGVKILRNLYNDAKKEKNDSLMAKYSEELFQVYEQRLKYLDKLNEIAKNKMTEAELRGQYGHDYTSYNPRVQVSRAYELLRKAGPIPFDDYLLEKNKPYLYKNFTKLLKRINRKMGDHPFYIPTKKEFEEAGVVTLNPDF